MERIARRRSSRKTVRLRVQHPEYSQTLPVSSLKGLGVVVSCETPAADWGYPEILVDIGSRRHAAGILFDEKIAGSFHFTPGKAYEEADNGNRSSIHWDMVMIQTPEFGGGEIHFDDVLVRRDGLFVLPELEALNPENLQ